MASQVAPGSHPAAAQAAPLLDRRSTSVLPVCVQATRLPLEQLRQEALQEQQMGLRAGLEALQLVAVPAKVTDVAATDLLHAIWPAASV